MAFLSKVVLLNFKSANHVHLFQDPHTLDSDEPKRIAIEWTEKGDKGFLEATSADGINFDGWYGYPRPHEMEVSHLKKYKAKDRSLLFFGKWWNKENGEEGSWVFQLGVARK